MQPEQLINEFLDAGKSVCPFARQAVRHYIHPPVANQRMIRRAYLGGVQDFVKTVGLIPYHTLIVSGPDITRFDYTQLRVWAINAFGELYLAFLRAAGGAFLASITQMEDQVRLLMDESATKRPILSYKYEPLHTVCMAPLYSKDHPRYAPHCMLVVTWGSDVADVQTAPGAREALHQKMFRVIGKYDADELVLPIR